MDIVDMFKGSVIEALGRFLRPVGHADVVLQTAPEWIRAAGAEALFGLKRDYLNKLVASHKVTAKKADKIVLYKYADIAAAITALPNKD